MSDQESRLARAVQEAQRFSIRTVIGLSYTRADPTILVTQTFAVRNLPLPQGRAAVLAMFTQHPDKPGTWCFSGITELATPAAAGDGTVEWTAAIQFYSVSIPRAKNSGLMLKS